MFSDCRRRTIREYPIGRRATCHSDPHRPAGSLLTARTRTQSVSAGPDAIFRTPGRPNLRVIRTVGLVAGCRVCLARLRVDIAVSASL